MFYEMGERCMSETNKKNIMYAVHSIIMIAVTFGIGLLDPPSVGNITELGMDVLGVFVGALYGWIFIGFVWPSFFAMLVLGMTEYGTITAIFSAGFGDSSVVMIFFMFVFAKILDECGLTGYLTNWFASRKICVGRPWVFTYLFFLGTIIISGVINMYGGIVILWYAMYNLFRDAGFKKGDAYVGYMIAGIVFISTLSVFVMPFLPMTALVLGFARTAVPDISVPSTAWMIIGPIFLISLVTIYVLAGKYILRINVDPLKNLGDRYADLRKQKLNEEQKFGLVLLLVFVAIVLLPTFLPAGNALKVLLNQYGALGASIVGICIAAYFKRGEEKFSFGSLVYKGVGWDLIILLAATMPLCAAMESDTTGIVSTVMGILNPMLAGLSPFAFIALCLVLFGLVTQVVHNMVLIIAFMPILANMAVSFGIHPALFALMFAIMMQNAFITPAASAQAAMVFGNTEWITSKQAYLYGTVFFICVLILELAIIYPLGMMLF